MSCQIKTKTTSVPAIMRTAAFRKGVADVRAGRPPRYEAYTAVDDSWNYERGRQWAVAAPLKMQVMDGKQVSYRAILVFERAKIR